MMRRKVKRRGRQIRQRHAERRFQLPNPERATATGTVNQQTWNALFNYNAATGAVTMPSSGLTISGDMSGKKIFIDPGHGGSDPGAINGSYKEKDYTLSISLKQKEYFEALGYQVMLSWSSDVSVDLLARPVAANNWGADLFISNHVNAGGGKGAEVYYSVYGGDGEAIANAVATNLTKDGLFYNRGAKTRRGDNGDYYCVIRESKMPAILIEHGFIDNNVDLATLNNPSDIELMARATVDAVDGLWPKSSKNTEPPVTDASSLTISPMSHSMYSVDQFVITANMSASWAISSQSSQAPPVIGSISTDSTQKLCTVTAAAPGTATISATVSGKTVSCYVTVTAAQLPSTAGDLVVNGEDISYTQLDPSGDMYGSMYDFVKAVGGTASVSNHVITYKIGTKTFSVDTNGKKVGDKGTTGSVNYKFVANSTGELETIGNLQNLVDAFKNAGNPVQTLGYDLGTVGETYTGMEDFGDGALSPIIENVTLIAVPMSQATDPTTYGKALGDAFQNYLDMIGSNSGNVFGLLVVPLIAYVEKVWDASQFLVDSKESSFMIYQYEFDVSVDLPDDTDLADNSSFYPNSKPGYPDNVLPCYDGDIVGVFILGKINN